MLWYLIISTFIFYAAFPGIPTLILVKIAFLVCKSNTPMPIPWQFWAISFGLYIATLIITALLCCYKLL